MTTSTPQHWWLSGEDESLKGFLGFRVVREVIRCKVEGVCRRVMVAIGKELGLFEEIRSTSGKKFDVVRLIGHLIRSIG